MSDKESLTPTQQAIRRYQEMLDNGEKLPDFVKINKKTGKVYIGGGNNKQKEKQITTVMIEKTTKERILNAVPREKAKTVGDAIVVLIDYWESKHAEEKAHQELIERNRLEKEIRKRIEKEFADKKKKKGDNTA